MPVQKLIEDRFGSYPLEDQEAPGNQTINAILGRASCRHFDPEPIPEPLIQTLLAAAFSSPSKSDLQQRTVILVRDRDKQQRIAALSESDWVAEAPLFMIWCGDNRRIRQIAEWRGKQFVNDHLDTFMNAAVDAAIAMQTFMIAAESAGLGCCPVSQVRNQIESLSAELELPDYVFPVAGLCAGWPGGEQPEISQRLPLSLTVHEDRYHDEEKLTELVADYDRRRETLSPTQPGEQRMPERFGVADDYGWSENRSRQYAVLAREDFGRYVRKQKFRLD